MPTFVEVIVNVPQAGDVFHYHLPQDWEGKILPGHLVVVPFGQQKVQGVIVQTIAEPSVAHTRPIIELVDPQPVLTSYQLSLAKYLAKSSLTSLAACVHLMLPPGLSRRAEKVYQLNDGRQEDRGRRTEDRSTGDGGPKTEAPGTEDRRPTLSSVLGLPSFVVYPLGVASKGSTSGMPGLTILSIGK